MAQEALRELEVEFGGAKREVVALRRKVVEQDGLVHEIERLREQVTAGASDELVTVRGDLDRLAHKAADMADYVRQIRKIHNQTMVSALIALGGGRQGLEKLTQIINGPDCPDVSMVSNDFLLGWQNRRVIDIIETRRDEFKHDAGRLDRTMEELAEKNENPVPHGTVIPHDSIRHMDPDCPVASTKINGRPRAKGGDSTHVDSKSLNLVHAAARPPVSKRR